MPRNTREWAHRKLASVQGNLDTALAHLEEVRDVYLADHPEIAEPLELAQVTIIEMGAFLKRLQQSF